MQTLISQNPPESDDRLAVVKPDRRRLSKIPDQTGGRANIDRRRLKAAAIPDGIAGLIESEAHGRRYIVDYAVTIDYITAGGKAVAAARAVDLSASGILLLLPAEQAEALSQAAKIKLKFTITPGSMPEGYEMAVAIEAGYIRREQTESGQELCGLAFAETLAQYAARTKNRYMLTTASVLLFFITACILLLRAESILYFKFNQLLYAYSIIAATFLLTRYLFGACYRPVPIDSDFTPGVSIIIPCFNEEQWIQQPMLACLNQDYPIDKLEVIVVDDCSSDDSFARISQLAAELNATEYRYKIASRLRCVRQAKNAGKREALARGALMARHELVVFVDSDSFLDPFAIRNIVQPFKDKQMGGVSGRTDVANTYTNALTKLQAVRYFIAFRIMKAAESYFDAVTCLSGPLSCYRRELVLESLDDWLNQRFLGQKATFGDDRSMTNMILRTHRTAYQDTAVCSTIVPNRHKVFLKQQMRWKRSWLRESLIAAGFMWKKEPFMALSFYMGVVVPILAPVIVLYNLVYIPAIHRVLPLTFITGLCLMALLMSMAQLLLRKSSTWVYGFLFCLYYEAVLLWQMPIAWVTFWKTTWGTRMTPADLEETLKKKPPQPQGAEQ